MKAGVGAFLSGRLVMATPQTATDGDYAAIESVVGHEYFHNWTARRGGGRVGGGGLIGV